MAREGRGKREETEIRGTGMEKERERSKDEKLNIYETGNEKILKRSVKENSVTRRKKYRERKLMREKRGKQWKEKIRNEV